MARMATKEAPPQTPQRPPEDIRSGRPALLSSTQLRSAARRVVSIVALAVIDVCGLALGLYVALIIRAAYYGESPILWGLPWKAEEKWLPFLALVTLLVFFGASTVLCLALIRLRYRYAVARDALRGLESEGGDR